MAQATTDHETIRNWAESKGGKPAAVDRTHQGGDVGIIRIMFPDNPQSEHQSLVEISWDEFFEQFEASNLALLFEEDGLFSKIIGRDTLERRQHGEHASRHHDRGESSRRERERSTTQAQSSSRDEEKRSTRGEAGDLKSREYHDEQGKVHHHTRTYYEQHGRGE